MFIALHSNSGCPGIIRGSAPVLANAFEPVEQFVRIDGFLDTGVNVIADGILKFGMKGLTGGAYLGFIKKS
jgi:hypothetical protein